MPLREDRDACGVGGRCGVRRESSAEGLPSLRCAVHDALPVEREIAAPHEQVDRGTRGGHGGRRGQEAAEVLPGAEIRTGESTLVCGAVSTSHDHRQAGGVDCGRRIERGASTERDPARRDVTGEELRVHAGVAADHERMHAAPVGRDCSPTGHPAAGETPTRPCAAGTDPAPVERAVGAATEEVGAARRGVGHRIGCERSAEPEPS